MKVTRLAIENFRSFVRMKRIELGPVNVLLGPNNAGKSSILKALHLIQEVPARAPDVRIGSTESTIEMELDDVYGIAPWHSWHDLGWANLTIKIDTSGNVRLDLENPERLSSQCSPLPSREPDHFVVPFLSKRKTAEYREDVSQQTATQVDLNFASLAAKLSRLSNPGYPFHQQYRETCEAILGFFVTAGSAYSVRHHASCMRQQFSKAPLALGSSGSAEHSS